MVYNCVCAGCNNSSKTGHRVHAFPKDKATLRQWVQFVLVRRADFYCGQASRLIEIGGQASRPSFLPYLNILAITVKAPQRVRTSFKIKAFVWYIPKDRY